MKRRSAAYAWLVSAGVALALPAFRLVAPQPAEAVELPLRELLLGAPQAVHLDDLQLYPSSHAALGWDYFDVYYHRSGTRRENYDLNGQRLRVIYGPDRWLAGALLDRSLLRLQQDNVYTSADRMRGEREHIGGRLYGGYRNLDWRAPLGVTGVRAIAWAGSNERFAGGVETELRWGEAARALVQLETFFSRLQVVEEIDGSRFPFQFPFRTSRAFGRLDFGSPQSLRLRAQGGVETSSGDGEEVDGFANRTWMRRYSGGASIDYGLLPQLRLEVVPRRAPDARGPGVRLAGYYSTGTTDIGMRFQGTRYLHLDDLQLQDATVRLDIVPLRSLSVFGGWQRMRLAHEGTGSFLDPWPFVIWDVFTAERYRLGDMSVQLDILYAGAGVLIDKSRLDFELSSRFEWWDDKGALRWLDRDAILFPFFFRYEGHDESVDINPRYAVQLDSALWLRLTSRMTLHLSGRATIPFATGTGGTGSTPSGSGGTGGTGGTTDTNGTGDNEMTHGGLFGRIEFILGF